MLISSFVKINYSENVPQSQVQYYAGSILFFASTLITEMAAISILAKTISPKLKLSYWNAGLFGGTADTFGRSVGNALYTLYTFSQGKAWEPFYAYIVSACIAFIFLLVSIIFVGRLKKHMEIHVGAE